MRPTAVGSASLVALATACGGGQTQCSAFDPLWSNDDGAGIAAFQEIFSQTAVPLGADVSISVETGGKAIVGVDLGSKAAPWRFV